MRSPRAPAAVLAIGSVLASTAPAIQADQMLAPVAAVSVTGCSATTPSPLGVVPRPVHHPRPCAPVAEPGLDPARAFAYSAVLPGLSQWIRGEWRWVGYALAEAVFWQSFVVRRGDGNRLRRQYRTLAWEVARGRPDPRVDGDFEYFERLGSFPASGQLDVDPSRPGVQPESDIETFNGSLWALAGEIFFPADGPPPDEASPAYQSALQYYVERGIGPELSWDWGDNAQERSDYRNLIRRSDDALRRSTTMIGLILGNHLISSIDAWISSGGGATDDEDDPVSVFLAPGSTATGDPLGRGFTVHVRIRR